MHPFILGEQIQMFIHRLQRLNCIQKQFLISEFTEFSQYTSKLNPPKFPLNLYMKYNQ